MLYHGAIVEDEAEVRSYLNETLTEALSALGCPIRFDVYPSGQRFLTVVQEHYHYDVVFLDIEMPEMDGIELCRHIRQVSPEALVIFISNHASLVFQTFEVQPFRFIRKSQYRQMLPDLARSVAERLEARQHNTVVITETSSGDLYSFDLQKLLYVESQRKECLFVTEQETTAVRCPLKLVEQQLPNASFLKPHRSYLVNCAHVFHITRSSIILTNRQEIPIGRGHLDEVRQQFLSYSMR